MHKDIEKALEDNLVGPCTACGYIGQIKITYSWETEPFELTLCHFHLMDFMEYMIENYEFADIIRLIFVAEEFFPLDKEKDGDDNKNVDMIKEELVNRFDRIILSVRNWIENNKWENLKDKE